MGIRYTNELTCSVGVTNLDAAIAWYAEVLGCRLLYRMDEIAWCEMASPMAGVNVGLSAVETVKQGGGATNVWTVEDIDVAKAHLAAHKVRIDGDIQTIPEMVRLLTFYDLDGNPWMFAQSLIRA